MFSPWIVMNITSARGTVLCRKTHFPCGDHLVICGQYTAVYSRKLSSSYLTACSTVQESENSLHNFFFCRIQLLRCQTAYILLLDG
jgi:hypothetical protein